MNHKVLHFPAPPFSGKEVGLGLQNIILIFFSFSSTANMRSFNVTSCLASFF